MQNCSQIIKMYKLTKSDLYSNISLINDIYGQMFVATTYVDFSRKMFHVKIILSIRYDRIIT